jgi:hypothetical protein
MIHGLGDPGSTTGDHQEGATGVTSHGDGVVDRRPDTRALARGLNAVTGIPGGLGEA